MRMNFLPQQDEPGAEPETVASERSHTQAPETEPEDHPSLAPAEIVPPSSSAGEGGPTAAAPNRIRVRVDPLQTEFLMRVANALNTTLDLQTLMHRTAELVRAVIDYKIFAILLLNERTNDLRMRFQIGHTPEAERMRIRMGEGVVGQAAQLRESILLDDVRTTPHYINANPDVRSELAVPLIVKNRAIGVLDIQAEQMGYFQQEHRYLLELTASRVGQAIENARLYTRVARQAQTLTVLNEIAREVSSILDLDPLLERIAQLLRRLIDYQMFSILLVNEREQVLETRYAVRFGHPVLPANKISLSRGLVGTAVRERKLIHVGDVRKDSRYLAVNPETRSEMAVPLIYKSTVIGVLDLEHTRVNYFNEDHERTLVTLASQMAIAIENARLYQRIALQEHRLEHDLAMAREVQVRLLPQKRPQHMQATLATKFLPARTIGGDLYDFLEYDKQTTAIAIGDVSGKGAPAALYAALTSGIMRSAAAQHPSPAAMLKQLNETVHERRVDSQYVTMMYAVWNDADLTLQIANAGAVQPLICRAGEVELVRAEGFPLGLFPDATYEEFTLSLQPGDSIVFYSDGVTDGQNEKDEMFGEERLIDVVRRHVHEPAQNIADAIFDSLGRFQAGKERFDDETVVVLKCVSP